MCEGERDIWLSPWRDRAGGRDRAGWGGAGFGEGREG